MLRAYFLDRSSVVPLYDIGSEVVPKSLEHSVFGWRKMCLPMLTQLVNRRRGYKGIDWNRGKISSLHVATKQRAQLGWT